MGLRRDRHDREPEYALAREAELYALIGMVTDYDCWRESDAPVEVAEVIAQLQANAGAARRLVVELARACAASAPSRSTPTSTPL